MPSPKSVLSTYVLPVVLFVVVVGGITWVIQFMPNWRAASTTGGTTTQTNREVLRFGPGNRTTGNVIKAVWEFKEGKDEISGPEESGYFREFEKAEGDGHYFIPFTNVLGEPAVFGLQQTACDCSSAAVCLLPEAQWQEIDAALARTPWLQPAFPVEPNWFKLDKLDVKGITIPAGARGLLRVTWHGLKSPGEELKVMYRFWSRPEAEPNAARQITDVLVPVVMTAPVIFEPVTQNVGILGAGESRTTEFHFWSPTRTSPNVAFRPAEADGLVTVEAQPLSPAECQELQKTLRAEQEKAKRLPTRVKSALLVRVTVHEQKDKEQMAGVGLSTRAVIGVTAREKKGKAQMDQGPFSRSVQVLLDELPLDIPPPQVTGTIRGEVEVGSLQDQGKVQLKTFSSAEDRTAVLALYSPTNVKLEQVSRYPEKALDVTLTRNEKKSTPSRTAWDLRVTVPAGSWTGSLPPDSVIVLRIVGEPPRLIRIPVTGIATR
jgi:hypothetical protein